eukprot:CAMPEP_0194276784 /NCGR_PEP_ID=MMETSP0169-20130528/9279_1 /TAXON_ID=218684 /ORGANISM="Corethron pennatum, Strain L29A3" /LENGTH=141 /DNA_ID=CAMNT_0039020575 /DNA_START=254 /DNA_END=679 /DNA_ORIENTATION=+
MAETLNESKHFVARVGTQLQTGGVQQSEDGRLTLRIALEPIHHRTDLLVDHLRFGIPNDAEAADGGLHLVSGGGINSSVTVEIPGMCAPPSLKVEAAIRILGIDRKSERVDVDIRKGGADAQAGLALGQVGPVNRADDGTP